MAAKKSLHPPTHSQRPKAHSKAPPHPTRSKAPPPPRPRPPPPPRRETIPVDTSWLLEEAPQSRRSKPPRRETMEVKLEWLEEAPRSSRRAPKRASIRPRASHPPARKGPPPLPASVAKPKRALPPPLPREEPEEHKPRRRSLAPRKR